MLYASLLAIALYTVASGFQWSRLAHGTSLTKRNSLGVGLRFCALGAHAIAAWCLIVTPSGYNLGLLAIGSLIAWFICTITVISSLRQPLDNLLAAMFPIAALTVLAGVLGDHSESLKTGYKGGLVAHILLSVLAYSVLAIAAFQSIALGLQERQLRRPLITIEKFNVLAVLPPLQTMERMLFELIQIGFVLLTLAIGFGAVYTEDLFAQHLAHKTLFTVLAWGTFAALLIGRHFRGWRGITAIRWTLSGFALLALAYIGSQVVLEFVLGR